MDAQSNLNPTLPQQPVLPTAPPPGEPVSQHQQIPKWLIVAAIIVTVLLVAMGIVQLTQRPSVVAIPTPTPTIPSSPTPIRTLSPIATTSAFLTLDSSVASYAATVKAYNTSDPSLSPPVLDLNLGL